MKEVRSEKEIMRNWRGDTPHPLVSICTITYNHEDYIEKALEGFLLQETDFPFEILVHDDASTDGTAVIIKEYEARYPNLIKPIYQTKNQFSQGIRPNPEFNFKRAEGRYIAICEGDDYWIDKYKLKKQALFLDENEKYSGSAHQSIVKYEISEQRDAFFRENNKDICLDDLMGGRIFHTASFMFRTNIVRNSPIPNNILSGDRYLFLLCALSGKIRFFSEPMCVYRKHVGGISNWVTYDLLKRDLNIPTLLYSINNEFPKYQYLSFIHKTLITYPREVLPFGKIIYHYAMYALLSFSGFPKNTKEMISFSLKKFPLILYRSASKVFT